MKSKKILMIVLVLIAATMVAAIAMYTIMQNNASVPQTINLYTTNDVHGGVNDANDNGLSYYNVAKLKENDNHTLSDGQQYSFLIDAGDHTSGSAFANYDNGISMVNAMKYANYDFAIPGNHEFDLGPEQFSKIRNLASSDCENMGTYEYYACNFWNIDPNTQTKTSLVTGNDGYKVIEATKPWNKEEKLKIALVGIMTPETISKTALGYFQDSNSNWVFQIDSNEGNKDMAIVVNTKIKDIKLKENVDLVIGVGHLGVDKESINNRSVDLIKDVNEDGDNYKFDAFIDGHSHTVATEKDLENFVEKDLVPNIPYIQTGTAFSNIGKLSISEDNGKYNIESNLISSLDKDDFNFISNPIANKTCEHISKWITDINKKLSEKIAKCDFTIYDCDDITKQSKTRLVRKQECNMADLCADAFYYKAENYGGCDASIINGGGIRKYIKEGDIRVLDCFDTMPYLNEFSIAEMPGSVLLDALEFANRHYNDGENGGFMHPAGITYDVDTSKPLNAVIVNNCWTAVKSSDVGSYRVQNVKIYNKETQQYEPLQINKTYKIAGCDYHFSKYGDGYLMYKNPAVVAINYHDVSANVLKDYLCAFDKDEDQNFPKIASATSPLIKYKNFKINYEEKYGASRTSKLK